ncbi:MAG: Re/Si-specific NAD(P)(+) transhydrogenase subunit alpha, partial [Candidatus Dormibacteraceae bacterium]
MVFTPREETPGEQRVALTPDTTNRLVTAGLGVSVERQAGFLAGHDDDSYYRAGAEVVAEAATGYTKANVVLKVRQPSLSEAGQLARQSLLISFLQPAENQPLIELLREREITAFSLELLPRISRAQSMDAL